MNSISQYDYTVLFGKDSSEVCSPIFRVFPGHVWVFQAFNFVQDKHRPDPVVEAAEAQQACLNQIVFKEGTLTKSNECGALVMDYDSCKGSILAENMLVVNNCCWCVNACNTVAILDIPGDYRWVLNDSTALKVVQLYARWYSREHFPYDSSVFYGRK